MLFLIKMDLKLNLKFDIAFFLWMTAATGCYVMAMQTSFDAKFVWLFRSLGDYVMDELIH